MKKIELRPYIYKLCEEFAFELCKEQGWFSSLNSVNDVTEIEKKEHYWINNWQIAVRSYLFWRDEF